MSVRIFGFKNLYRTQKSEYKNSSLGKRKFSVRIFGQKNLYRYQKSEQKSSLCVRIFLKILYMHKFIHTQYGNIGPHHAVPKNPEKQLKINFSLIKNWQNATVYFRYYLVLNNFLLHASSATSSLNFLAGRSVGHQSALMLFLIKYSELPLIRTLIIRTNFVVPWKSRGNLKKKPHFFIPIG